MCRNWRNSSIAVGRSHLPTLVIFWFFMVLNFQTLNGCLFFPSLTCEKNTGPWSSIVIRMGMMISSGINTVRAMRAIKISSERGIS